MAGLRQLWIRLRRGNQAPEPRPKTDEEEYQERRRELLLDDKDEAQRRDFRV